MPTYEYQCKKCSYNFEKFQSITAKPLQYCPKCKGEVFRLISKNCSFILKGNGYYSTDNRKSQLSKEKKSKSDKPAKNNSDKPVAAEKKTATTKNTKESVKS